MNSDHIESIIDLAADLAGKADDIEEVLILYTRKSDGTEWSMDNCLTVAQANFLVDKFKHWLFRCMEKEER
jgi:hypothetical protein